MAEKPFPGFPTSAEVTPIPNLFFTMVMPRVEDITELKVILHIFWLLSRRRGYPRFVTCDELLSAPLFMSSTKEGTKSKDEMFHHALHMAVQHGILLHLELVKDGESEDAYFINTETERDTVDKIRRGELELSGLVAAKGEATEVVVLSDIFSLYEQNIGMLTPLITEELQEAEKLYPADWIENAFREAVALNKRSWKYIARILERWAVEGKDDGKSGRDSKKEGESSKYIRGRYGHMVER